MQDIVDEYVRLRRLDKPIKRQKVPALSDRVSQSTKQLHLQILYALASTGQLLMRACISDYSGTTCCALCATAC